MVLLIMSIYLFLKQHKKLTSLVVILCDFLFFCLTNPNKLSVAFLVVGFLLALATLNLICSLVIILIRQFRGMRKLKNWTKWAISGFAFILLVMQSIGQLSIKDIVVLIPLVFGIYFYYIRSKNAFPE